MGPGSAMGPRLNFQLFSVQLFMILQHFPSAALAISAKDSFLRIAAPRSQRPLASLTERPARHPLSSGKGCLDPSPA